VIKLVKEWWIHKFINYHASHTQTIINFKITF
jgi:hypothetical protein